MTPATSDEASRLERSGEVGSCYSRVVQSGRLEVEPLPALCRRLAAESRTGCLRIGDAESPEHDILLYLRDGRLYTAHTTEGRLRLGERLVQGGHVSPVQLRQALAAQDDGPPGVRLGDVLVAQGFVPREVLRAVVREQISDTIGLAITTRSGTWAFHDGASVAEDVPLGLGIQDALMEGARRLDDLTAILEGLGGEDAVLDFHAGATDVTLALRAREWGMLTHINGRNSVADVADRAGRPLLDAARMLHGLLVAGVVRHVREQAPTLPAEDYGDLMDELEGLGGGSGSAEEGVAVVPPPPAPAPPVDPQPAPAPALPATPDPAAPRPHVAGAGALFADLNDEDPPPPPPPPPGPRRAPSRTSPPQRDDPPEGGGLLGRLRRR